MKSRESGSLRRQATCSLASQVLVAHTAPLCRCRPICAQFQSRLSLRKFSDAAME